MAALEHTGEAGGVAGQTVAGARLLPEARCLCGRELR